MATTKKRTRAKQPASTETPTPPTAAAAAPRLQVVVGNIIEQDDDVIVNAANEELQPGGGVCGVIHRAAGPRLARACAEVVATLGGRCATGTAAITPGFNLKSKYVVHAVGPVWAGGEQGEPELLASAYREALKHAAALGAKSIAFPAISTGIYGYPADRAAHVAVVAIQAHLQQHDLPERVLLVAFNEPAREHLQSAVDAYNNGVADITSQWKVVVGVDFQAPPKPYTVPEGKVLVLRTCRADMQSPSSYAGGFVWPRSGPVKAPDWRPHAECGHGLHGALWGEGSGAEPWCWDADANWLVVEVDANSIVSLEGGSKVKFPEGIVVFCGERHLATAFLAERAPSRKIIGHTATAGYSGTATAGDSGTATAGYSGTATAGYSGTATAGELGTISLRWYDGKRHRVASFAVGEDGILPNTFYRLDAKGKPFAVEKCKAGKHPHDNCRCPPAAPEPASEATQA